MKTLRLITPLALLAVTGFSLSSCQEKAALEAKGQVSAETLEQIQAHGYSTVGVQKVADGIMVEGDMLLTPEMLASRPQPDLLLTGTDEQYRSSYKVAVPADGQVRTITVKLQGFTSTSGKPYTYQQAADKAIWRYNAQKLKLRFQRITDGPADITISKDDNLGSTLGQSKFPRSGNPGDMIRINQTSLDNNPRSLGNIATLIAHEMGHAIGFRHTDYFDRSISNCSGSEGNYADFGNVSRYIGLAQIEGTPARDGVDTNSWMLACQQYGIRADGSGYGDRPFTNFDIIALNYLYKR